jgi:uncharacterized membrane protein YdjX (TVP38/TMEM64 family)
MASPTPPEPTPLSDSTTKPAYLRIVVGVLLLAGIVYLGRSAGAYVPQFAEWVEGLGVLGPIVFILGYAAAVVALIPGSVMTLASGAIFGLAEGTLYVFVAATLGSTLAFLIARHAARASIEKRIEGDVRFAAIDRAVGVEGRKIVVLLRLSPIFPFNLLNYALGLTRVRLVDYLIASFGMLPGTLLYVYSGMLLGDVAAIAAGVETERGAAGWWVLGLGFAATLAVTIYVTRIAKRALDAATSKQVQDPTE